jgi:hypothetical protein
MSKKKSKKLHGRVKRIIAPVANEPEKAEIEIDEAEDLSRNSHRECRY